MPEKTLKKKPPPPPPPPTHTHMCNDQLLHSLHRGTQSPQHNTLPLKFLCDVSYFSVVSQARWNATKAYLGHTRQLYPHHASFHMITCAKVPYQKVARWPKCFSFFFFFFFSQASSNLDDRLIHIGFCTKQQHFLLSCAPAHHFFYRFEVLQDGSNCSLKNYGFLCNTIFFLHVYACAQII